MKDNQFGSCSKKKVINLSELFESFLRRFAGAKFRPRARASKDAANKNAHNNNNESTLENTEDRIQHNEILNCFVVVHQRVQFTFGVKMIRCHKFRVTTNRDVVSIFERMFSEDFYAE